uniref:CXXC-type domain-containing protein n=1 Tax=Caenorhabditis tropicalis TaxID=1561998 RepID=A0A1I7U3M1_9PELO
MSSHRSTTSRRCGVCRGCQCKPCGQCTYCQDSPQFGGPGVKKQSCIERRCLRVLENRLQRDAPTFKARVGCNACEDCRMQDCQICLVCLDKRFFENRHIPGAMCAKKRCNNAQSIECVPSQQEFIQRAPKRSYEMISPVIQQPQMNHFDVKRVQYMSGPPPPPQMMQQMQMQQQQQQTQQVQVQSNQQVQVQQNQQVQQQQQQRPNSNSSHSQGPSPPRVQQVQQPQQQQQQQNGGVHHVNNECVNAENLEQQQQQQQHHQQQQPQQQQRMMFQQSPYPDMNGHSRMMAPPLPVSAPAPMPLPQNQMTHMPQHGLDIPFLIPAYAQSGQSDPFYPSKYIDYEHNGDPFVPPSYAQDMKGQVVLQPL